MFEAKISALYGLTMPGTTWANERNFIIIYAPGVYKTDDNSREKGECTKVLMFQQNHQFPLFSNSTDVNISIATPVLLWRQITK